MHPPLNATPLFKQLHQAKSLVPMDGWMPPIVCRMSIYITYRKETLLCSAGAQVTHDVPASVFAADIPTINKDDWSGAPDSKP